MQSATHRLRAAIVAFTMLATMLTAVAPALADPDQGTAGPGDPCSSAEYPGSKLVTLAESRQSFVPSRGGLDWVEVCIQDLVGIAGNDFTLNIYQGGTASSPGTQVASVGHNTNGNILAATWVRIQLPQTLSVTPGTPYVLGLDPASGVLSSVIFQWRATCNDGLLTSCSGVEDAYPDGNTNDLPGNADYSFRTDAPPANLVGSVEMDPALGCPGGVPDATGTVANEGQTSVAASEAEWWLSADPTLSDDDTFLGTRSVPILDAGASHVVAPPDALPTDLALGSATLLLHVDSSDVVVESGETDNVAGHLIEVTDCGQPDFANVAVSIDEDTVSTAFRNITADGLPVHDLAHGLPTTFDEATENLEASPYGFSPVGFSPLGFSPLGFSPVGFSPLGFSPYGFSPLGFSPLGFSPLGFSPLGFSSLNDLLGDIPRARLDEVLVVNVPVAAPGWEERILAADPTALDSTPIQDYPLGAALDLLGDTLTAQDVDIRAIVNSSWLASATAGGVLNDFPPPSSHAGWCSWLLDVTDYDCAATGFDPAAHSLLAADVFGVTTRALPIGELTLDQVNINPNWLLNDVLLTGTPRAHPELTRLGGEAADAAFTDPDVVIDCGSFDCSRPVAEAASGGHFLNVDVATMLSALSESGLAATTVSDLALLVADINTLDLGDMLWTKVNGYQVNNSCDTMAYHVTADNIGDAAAVDSEIVVTLAQGFSYVPLSATLSVDGGPGTAQAEPVVTVSDDGTRTLTFQTDSIAVSSLDLSFAACASLYVGDFAAGTATINAVGLGGPVTGTSTGSSEDVVEVVELTEEAGPTDTPDTAQLAEANSVMALNFGSAADVDHIKIPVPEEPNSLTIVRAFPTPTQDVDLFAHGPAVSPLGFSPVGFSPVGFSPLGFSPVGFSPVGFSPFGFSPLGFSPLGFSPLGFSDDSVSQPDTLNDIPTHLAPSDTTGLKAISAHRGDVPETLMLRNHDGDDGFFTVGIAPYNGASFAGPVIVTVQQIEAVQNAKLATCTPAPWDLTGTAGAAPEAWNGTEPPRTLFVTNRQVVESQYGATTADAGVAALEELAARPEIQGIVLNVDHDPDVRQAYADWRSDWCSPAAANIAASLVRREILELRATHPSIDTIVLAGGDEVLPDFRLPDASPKANEWQYTESLLNAYGENNPVVAAFANGTIMSPDPYGTMKPSVFGSGFAYLPTAGISRLLDPDTWVSQKDRYVNSGGELDPAGGMVSGYDGMVDGALAAAAALDQQGIPTSTLTTDGWTANDFRSSAFAATSEIAGWNAHANHWAELSSFGSNTKTETDIVTTADQDAFPFGVMVFSNGCHFGTQAPNDVHPGSPTAEQGKRLLDWSEAITGTQVQGIAVANSGFGIFDTEVVGYGEQLQLLYVEALENAPNAAAALASAKAEYFASLGVYDPYQYKTVQQLAMFGLGIFKMAGATGELPEPPPADAESLPVDIGSIDFDQVDTADGTFFDVPDSAAFSDTTPLSVDGRPIVPKVTQQVTLPDGKASAGLWFTDFESVEVANVDPLIARAAVSDPDREGESQVRPTIAPTTPGLAVDVGDTAFVTLPMGAFRHDGTVDGHSHGAFRLNTAVEAQLLLRDAASDGPAPHIAEVTASQTQDGSLVAVDVLIDETFGPVVEAAALALDDQGEWTYRQLHLDNGHWKGAFALSSGATEVRELLVQARNAHRVGYWHNKGEAPRLRVDIVDGVDMVFLSTEGQASNGVFLGDVTATIVGAPGVTYTVWDGVQLVGSFEDGDSFVISGDGVHEIEVAGTDGSRAVETVVIDGTGPVITVGSPADGAVFTAGEEQFLEFDSSDAASDEGGGCVATVNGDPIENGDPLPTGTIGTYELVVVCTDGVGNETTVTVTYEVVSAYRQPIEFNSPVKAKPKLNDVSPSSMIPIKFSVFWAETGQAVTDVSIVAGRFWVPINCSTKAATGSSFAATGSDPEFTSEFHYNTSAPSTKGCYELFVELDDGTLITAYFRVK